MTRFSFDGKLETMGDEIRPSLAVVIHVGYSFFFSTLLSYTLLIFCKCHHHHHHHIYSPFCKWFNKHIITNRGGRLSQKPSGSLDRPPIVYYTIIYYLCYQKKPVYKEKYKKYKKTKQKQCHAKFMTSIWFRQNQNLAPTYFATRCGNARGYYSHAGLVFSLNFPCERYDFLRQALLLVGLPLRALLCCMHHELTVTVALQWTCKNYCPK